ncbi:MAG: hypothetical protein VKP63_10600, partial [Cyanobacteriota bacterium]|nr:hypothetical protein [Cyanobacteriota bacterium]
MTGKISGEIKPSTWHRVDGHHRNHVLGAVPAVVPPQNAKQLLETLARISADKPGGRTRQMMNRPLWKELRREIEAKGEKLVPYSCRHGDA